MTKYILNRESYIVNYLNNVSDIENNFNMSDILESMGVAEQSLLDIIDAKPIDFEEFFETKEINDIEIFADTNTFMDKLVEKNLKHGKVENSEDYETFLLSPIRYVLIHDSNANELESPKYILIQNYNTTEQKWSSAKLYEVLGDFNKFYDKLSSRTIELEYNDKKYIYSTSIKNEWELNNTEPTDMFPKYIRNTQLSDIVKTNKGNIKVKLMG